MRDFARREEFDKRHASRGAGVGSSWCLHKIVDYGDECNESND